MLKLHANIAETIGVKKENIFVLDNGQSLNLKNHIVTRSKNDVPADDIYLDGYNINGISSNIIKERQMLKDDGLIAITATIDNHDYKILKKPRIFYKGFVIDNEDKFRTTIENAVYEVVRLSIRNNVEEIKTKMINATRGLIHQITERDPLIVPIILSKN